MSRFEDVWRAEQDLEATTVRAGVTSYQLLAPREQREASRLMNIKAKGPRDTLKERLEAKQRKQEMLNRSSVPSKVDNPAEQ